MKPLGDLISFITKDHIIKIFYAPSQTYEYCSDCKSNIFCLQEAYSFVQVSHMKEYYYYAVGYCYICKSLFNIAYDKRAIQNMFYESIPTIDI